MVEVEDCLDEINRLQLNFHSSVIDKMEQSELLKLAKEWQNQFKYWALMDFKKVVDHLIKTNKYFPKPSEFWSIKKEIIIESKDETLIFFACGYCKETGIRAYKDKSGDVHICRCDCQIGRNHYKHLPFLSETQKEGLSEYRIHDNQKSFAFIPQGEDIRLAREIAGKNESLLRMLNNAEKNIKSYIPETIKTERQKRQYDEELPF